VKQAILDKGWTLGGQLFLVGDTYYGIDGGLQTGIVGKKADIDALLDSGVSHPNPAIEQILRMERSLVGC
jgi:hypothetical protein